MKKISEYIQSGIIESYVLGMLSSAEAKEVEEMAAANEEVRAAINEFSKTLEQQALRHAIEPDPIVKPMLLATINYIARLEKGEPAGFPPLLNEHSKITDYSQWLQRKDMVLPLDAGDVYARIIGYTREVTTAIVWIKNMAPAEVHTREMEKFLIAEGTCEVIIEEDVHQLAAGDFFEIPLFKSHLVNVTSDMPCKIILQRVAA